MGWLRIFGKSDAKPAEPAATGTPARPRKGDKPGDRQQPLSGYGNNPYDTYTWELHPDPNSDRALKRAHRIDRKTDEVEKEKSNPYDTGRFTGGW